MKIEVMEWKTEMRGKTYRHKVYATIGYDLENARQISLDYAVVCLDTGVARTFSELRSVVDDVLDLRPSFKILQQLREGP